MSDYSNEIEPPRFRFFTDDFCRPALVQFEDLPYQTGSLAHCFTFEHNKLTIRYYEAENGSTIGSRKYRKHIVPFELNEIYQWMNDKIKPKQPVPLSMPLVESLNTVFISYVNENYHMSVNDFRVEGDFLRVKLNPYFVPNSQTSQFFFLTIDTALCTSTKLMQTLAIVVVMLKEQPVPFIASFKELKPQMPLFEFLVSHFNKTGSTFALKNTKKTLDYSSTNFSVGTKPVPAIELSSQDSLSSYTLSQLSQSSDSSAPKKRPRLEEKTELNTDEFYSKFSFTREPDISGLIHDPGDGKIYVRSDAKTPIIHATFQYYTHEIDAKKTTEQIHEQYTQAFTAARQYIIQRVAAAKSLS